MISHTNLINFFNLTPFSIECLSLYSINNQKYDNKTTLIIKIQSLLKRYLSEKIYNLHLKRFRVAKELLETEINYVNYIEQIVTQYLLPISELDLNSSKIIFKGLEVIYHYNKEFLINLKPIIDNWNIESRLDSIFKKMTSFASTYKVFINNYDEAAIELKNIMQKTKFRKIINDNRKPNQLSLPSLLIMPVQRLPRYILLLEEITKRTPIDHPDSIGLNQTIIEMKNMVQDVNTAKTEYIKMKELINIQNNLKRDLRKSKFNLVRPSRTLIEEWDVEMRAIKNKLISMKLYLFSDLIILCKREKRKKLRLRFETKLRIDKYIPLNSLLIQLTSDTSFTLHLQPPVYIESEKSKLIVSKIESQKRKISRRKRNRSKTTLV